MDSSGETNTLFGMVERDGNFWVENMPLGSGANSLTLTVRDSAGNVAVTNITVLPSDVSLSINMPSSDQLWNQGITVSGTISDWTDYAVWVNGVKATVDGYGNWTAANVDLPAGGTALFQARAIPMTDNGGNGSGGSGGGPVTDANLGNPDPSGNLDTEVEVDKPSQLIMWNYTDNESDLLTDTVSTAQGPGYETQNNTLAGGWVIGFGGWSAWTNATVVNNIGGNTAYTNWFNVGFEAEDSNPDYSTETTSYPLPLGDVNFGVLNPNQEYCDVGVPVVDKSDAGMGMDGPWTMKDVGHRKAFAHMLLETGGKGTAHRQDIYQFSATAQQNYCNKWPYLDYTSSQWWQYPTMIPAQWQYPTTIPVQQIVIDGTPLNSNGYVYKIYPDNTSVDVTPQVKGVNYFTFNESQQKYLSYFEVYVNMPFPPGSGIPLPGGFMDYPDCTGWPDLASDWGHARWRLSTDAPTDAVNEYIPSSLSLFLGSPVGYGTPAWTPNFDFYYNHIPGIYLDITGPGKLWDPDGDTTTVYKKYNIGFNELINALSYVNELQNHPGTYDALANNCVIQTRVVGGIVGIALPSDTYPESFGLHLDPMPDDQ